MPLLVGVNSYLSADDADSYFVDRLYVQAWTDATTAQRESALVMAARSIDSQHYQGAITSDIQAMAWPRTGVYDLEGRAIGAAVVPDAIRHAQAEIALGILQEDPADARDPAVKKMQAGSVSVEYRSGTSATALRGAALALLKPFLADFSGASARMLP